MHLMRQFIQSEIVLLLLVAAGVAFSPFPYVSILLAGVLMILYTVKNFEEKTAFWILFLQFLVSVAFCISMAGFLSFLVFYAMGNFSENESFVSEFPLKNRRWIKILFPAAIMTLDAADMLYEVSPEKARLKMNTANDRIRESLSSIRQAVRILDTDNEILTLEELRGTLSAVAEQFSMDTMIRIFTDWDAVDGTLLISKAHTEFLTGPLQELLTNGVKHGQADCGKGLGWQESSY